MKNNWYFGMLLIILNLEMNFYWNSNYEADPWVSLKIFDRYVLLWILHSGDSTNWR